MSLWLYDPNLDGLWWNLLLSRLEASDHFFPIPNIGNALPNHETANFRCLIRDVLDAISFQRWPKHFLKHLEQNAGTRLGGWWNWVYPYDWDDLWLGWYKMTRKWLLFENSSKHVKWGLPHWSDADFQVKSYFLNTAAGYHLYLEISLDFWIAAIVFPSFLKNALLQNMQNSGWQITNKCGMAAPLFDLFRDPMSFI